MAEYLIPRKFVAPYDAMVVMRAGVREFSFVLNKTMSDEQFIECCLQLKKLVLEKETL